MSLPQFWELAGSHLLFPSLQDKADLSNSKEAFCTVQVIKDKARAWQREERKLSIDILPVGESCEQRCLPQQENHTKSSTRPAKGYELGHVEPAQCEGTAPGGMSAQMHECCTAPWLSLSCKCHSLSSPCSQVDPPEPHLHSEPHSEFTVPFTRPIGRVFLVGFFAGGRASHMETIWRMRCSHCKSWSW